jgi:hypothetical protein
MPQVTITRNNLGKIDGVDEKNQRAYRRFVKRMQELTPGCTLVFKWWEPRSPRFHRYHFAILGALFKLQDRFADEDDMRKWLETGAGYCTFAPGIDGNLCAIPKSIAYEKLDDVEFQELHQRIKTFMRSTHVTRHLWPHLNDVRGLEMIDRIIDSFELLN